MATNMFYPIDEFLVANITQLLNKNGFRNKVMVNEEKNAIKGFIEKLADPQKYKALWITKTGDKYEYLMDKKDLLILENEEKYDVDVDMGVFFAEYICKVWGVDAVMLLRILSLDGMCFLHKALAHLIINIRDTTQKHKALVFKLHKIKVEEKIAVDKIKRNAIYNMGLGLKLAVKAYSKEF